MKLDYFYHGDSLILFSLKFVFMCVCVDMWTCILGPKVITERIAGQSYMVLLLTVVLLKFTDVSIYYLWILGSRKE